MKLLFSLLCVSALLWTSPALAGPLGAESDVLIVVAGEQETSATAIAVERLAQYSASQINVRYNPSAAATATPEHHDLTILLGVKDAPAVQDFWTGHESAKEDSYLVETVSTAPLVIVASGTNDRSMLYAAYRLADLIKAKKDLGDINLFFEPKIAERFVSFGATTHGRREYRPELFWKTLNELPTFGYNGLIIYPGGGTPIGRHASPIVESEDGQISLDAENTRQWREWLARVDAYDLDIMMTVPPTVPPGFTMKEIRDYYAGGPEPAGYREKLRSHFRQYLKLLTETYPAADLYMFNSTEGATFGRNQRFFGQPAPNRFPVDSYVRNNEAVMTAYFDVLKEHFAGDLDKVMFWTHSFGLTSDGIEKMREVLFRYPEITIIEDDFWNNNLWPSDLPAMAYLPEDLRAQVSEKNPFALFQIATDGEYFGGGSLPNAYAESHIRTANEALQRDARMVIQRLDLHDRTPYGTAFGSMEIVPLSASRQLWEPTPETTEIWKDWAERRFGKEAAPYVVKALQESRSVILNGLSCNGLHMLGVGSEFASRVWFADGSGITRFYLFQKPGIDLVDKKPDDVIFSEEYTPYQRDTHSIAIGDIRANQQKAQDSIKRGLQQIEQAKPHLAPADYEMLKDIYVNGENVLNAVRLLGELAYATNIMLDNFDRIEDPKGNFDKAVNELQAYLKEDKLIPQMSTNIENILENYKTTVREAK